MTKNPSYSRINTVIIGNVRQSSLYFDMDVDLNSPQCQTKSRLQVDMHVALNYQQCQAKTFSFSLSPMSGRVFNSWIYVDVHLKKANKVLANW